MKCHFNKSSTHLRLNYGVSDLSAGKLTVKYGPLQPGENSIASLWHNTILVGIAHPNSRRAAAEFLTHLNQNALEISLVSTTSKRITVDMKPQGLIHGGLDFKKSGISDDAGIYEITFHRSQKQRSYVGQSGNIAKRLRQHIHELRTGTHHNVEMQIAWISNPNSFCATTVSKSETGQSAISMAIDRTHAEQMVIYDRKGRGAAVNKISADVALNAELRSEINSLRNSVEDKIKKVRHCVAFQKNALGQLFIDLGLFDMNIPRTVKATITSSNVLSWLNKYGSAYTSPLAWLPKINYSNPFFMPLKNSIRSVQEKIRELDKDAKYCRDFHIEMNGAYKERFTGKESAIKKLQELDQKYSSAVCSTKDIKAYVTVKGNRVSYNSAVLDWLDAGIVRQL